jgi:hypothetical protein
LSWDPIGVQWKHSGRWNFIEVNYPETRLFLWGSGEESFKENSIICTEGGRIDLKEGLPGGHGMKVAVKELNEG